MRAQTRWPSVLLLVAVATVAGVAGAQDVPRIGVFDPQRVSEETEIGRQVQTELKGLADRKQAEITAQERQIADLQRQLGEQGLSLSADRRALLERDIQTKLLQLQSARDVANRELQLEVNAAQNSFESKLLATVQAFGKEEGFTLVIARDLLAWADASIDVTDRVIERFNRMHPAAEAAPAP
jgi:outer membrane protein